MRERRHGGWVGVFCWNVGEGTVIYIWYMWKRESMGRCLSRKRECDKRHRTGYKNTDTRIKSAEWSVWGGVTKRRVYKSGAVVAMGDNNGTSKPVDESDAMGMGYWSWMLTGCMLTGGG